MIVIGGGPAGLMAAETLIAAGVQVDVYDAMPSLGRKFLLAGVGGMNITHSEPRDVFATRYGARQAEVNAWLDQFDGPSLREWVHGLGVETFVGTSGRVFPVEMKAAPLLRAWLHRLKTAGVRFHVRHRWLGWAEDGRLLFETPRGQQTFSADAVVLALGGGSWAKLGSDGAWAPWLSARGVDVAPLQPSNCGFNVNWTPHFVERYAGHPLKSVLVDFTDHHGEVFHKQGEFVVTQHGIEGSLIYAASARIRDTIAANGSTTLYVDLAPGKDYERILQEVAHPRGSRSLSSHLQSRVGLKGVKMGLLWEALSKEAMNDPQQIAKAIKALPITLVAPRPIDEAISSAGGVRFEALDPNAMLPKLPGVFCAGEMIDWEAPTGGYLLTACFASGKAAAEGVVRWLRSR